MKTFNFVSSQSVVGSRRLDSHANIHHVPQYSQIQKKLVVSGQTQ